MRPSEAREQQIFWPFFKAYIMFLTLHSGHLDNRHGISSATAPPAALKCNTPWLSDMALVLQHTPLGLTAFIVGLPSVASSGHGSVGDLFY